MENKSGENQENKQINLIKQQIESGVPEDDALEAAFIAAQEADKASKEQEISAPIDGYQMVHGELNITMPQEAEDDTQNVPDWKDPFEESEEIPSVKKYIVYVAKDFIPKLEELDSDERNAYINDSLKLKEELGKDIKRVSAVKNLLKHGVVALLTVVIGTPVVFFIINHSIDLTLSNYSYMQKNFESLYEQKVERDKAAKKVTIIKEK